MKKMVCYKKSELATLLYNLLKISDPSIKVEIDFSEELNTECVYLYQNNVLINTQKLEEMLKLLSTYEKKILTSYDILEVGDFGDMFVFFVEEESNKSVSAA